MTALFRIGYGLYVVTSNDGKKDNGLIVNTVTQLTDSPFRVAIYSLQSSEAIASI